MNENAWEIYCIAEKSITNKSTSNMCFVIHNSQRTIHNAQYVRPHFKKKNIPRARFSSNFCWSPIQYFASSSTSNVHFLRSFSKSGLIVILAVDMFSPMKIEIKFYKMPQIVLNFFLLEFINTLSERCSKNKKGKFQRWLWYERET